MSRHEHRHGQYVLAFGRTILTSEAADMLNVSAETVRKMLEDGTLDGYRVRPNKKKSPWLVFKWSVERHIARLTSKYNIQPAPAHVRSANATHSRDTANRTAG